VSGKFPRTEKRKSGEPLTLVLSSGGIDSTVAVAMVLSQGQAVETLFVDYGQAAAAAEERASAAVAAHFGIQRCRLRLDGLAFGAGEIRARNAFLVHVALLAFPRNTGTVVLGIHAGTPYADCSEAFVDETQRSFDMHTGGAVSVSAPFVGMDKGAVFTLGLELRLPIALTHSCEAGDEPCMTCLSCQDREALLASS
jgi:7-cyano-7-deazaguanine synthase